MKTKLWERTSFRIIIFILCALFLSASLCLVVFGDSRLAEYQTKEAKNIQFDVADVFTRSSFFESRTLTQTMRSKLYEFVYLYTSFAGTDGVQVKEGASFERVFDEIIYDLYERIKNSIDEREHYEPPYEPSPSPDSYPKSERYEYTYPPVIYTLYFSEMYSWRNSWNWNGQDEYFEFDEEKMLNDPVLAPDGKLRSIRESGVREAFEALFPAQIAEIREMVAYERNAQYQNSINALGETLYFASDGNKVLSNLELDERGYPVDPDALRYQKVWIVMETGSILSSLPGFSDGIVPAVPAEDAGATYHMALPDDVFTEYEIAFNNMKIMVVIYFFTAVVLLVLAIVFLIMLLVFSGRKRPAFEDTRKLWKCDKIFVEFQIVLFFLAFGLGFLFAEMLLREAGDGWFTTSVPGIILSGTILFVLLAALLWFVLSLVRNAKAGLFAERSLIGRLATGPCKALSETIKTGYNGKNPLAKTVILVILLWFVTALFAGLCGMALYNSAGAAFAFFILLIVVLIGALYFTRKWAERYGRLRKGVEEIASGNISYKIELDGDGKNEFDSLSAMVNELGSAHNTAVQNELKNQRLKTDLISNVSHDLKTPLTSIITYTDLLKKEGLKSKNAEEYLKIIDEKGRRLQKLTEDLFDAAKASSGAIQVRKEKVDLLALLNQEIAEFNGSFVDAGLDLVINAENEHYFVEADGQLLWRVVDNLLRNVCKYAMPGTRVYLDFKEHHSSKNNDLTPASGALFMTTLEIKNTSAAKLNIPPDELMERFKRGDEARATEGSGLGLAIAKDLVRLQGGWFEIIIDGDLFKVIVMLPPYAGD